MEMYSTKRMSVKKLLLQETGTYNEQYRRPYVTNLSGETRNDILEAVEGKNNITAASLSNVSMGFIAPAANWEAQVVIPNGWNTPRLRFILEVYIENNMGMGITEYITGYTEYSDQSLRNRIDPKMMFFINNISQTKTVTNNTPLGNQSYQSLIDSSHVLVNNNFSSMFDTAKVYSLKPESIIQDIDTQSLGMHVNDMVYNTTTSFVKTQPAKANRKNNIAPIYIASLLDGYLQSSRAESDETHSRLLAQTHSALESASFSKDNFLMFLQLRLTQRGHGIALGNTFTLEDLIALDPNTTNVMKLADYMPGGFHQTGQSAGWGGSDGITQYAATIAQALPAYLTQFCFNTISFTSTNHTVTGEIVTAVSNVRGFNSALDLSNEISAFVFRLNNDLLMGLSYGNRMPFQLEVNCDLMGETWIELSLNNEPMTTFVTPSFCDSLTTPIITSNADILHGIARDFDGLMTSIAENDTGRYGISTTNGIRI